MITRMYPNAKGDLQTVVMSPAAWEAISEDGLNRLLGYGVEQKEEPEAIPVKAPVIAKGNKK